MDERLEKALEFGNYRQTLANQKRNIKARMEVLQLVPYEGGTFSATPLLISFVGTLMTAKKTTAIVLDTKEKPVKIADLSDFLETLISAYTEASNEFSTHMEKINKARNIKKIMDW
jgi:hypothetical protein